MMRNDSKAPRRGALWAAVSLGLVVAYSGCGLDEVQIPDLEGPSELGIAVTMTAVPDVITADGFSTSLITATVRDHNGRPIAGRDIFFTITDASGSFADIGSLRTSNGPGTGATVRTDAQGNAQIVYQAPARTDATANQFVQVAARPYGTDAKAANYRVVAIELRSAEPRLFAPNPDNTDPSCGFTVEIPTGSCAGPTPVPTATPTPVPTASPTATPTPSAAPGAPGGCAVRVNTSVLFQSTAFDRDGTIVRYFWDFGNGRQGDSPDGATSYNRAGSYTVTHVVTDNNGAQQACQATITVR
jgi:PKD repeat protein